MPVSQTYVTWTNPTLVGLDGILVLVKTASYSTGVTDGTVVNTATTTSCDYNSALGRYITAYAKFGANYSLKATAYAEAFI